MAKGIGKNRFLEYFNLNDSSDDDFDDDMFDDDDDFDEDDYDEADEYDDYADDEYSPSASSKKSSPLKSFKTLKNNSSSSAAQVASGNSRGKVSSSSNGNGKLVSIASRSDGTEVFVIKPDEFDDAQLIVDHLSRGQIIVINMEDLDVPTAQRIADFIGGASYALEGEFLALSGNMFLTTPNGVYVSGDLRESLTEEALQETAYTGRTSY
jgi:cell division inhibitor SepF